MEPVSYFKWREEIKVVLLTILTLTTGMTCYLMYKHCNTVEMEEESLRAIAEILLDAEVILTD